MKSALVAVLAASMLTAVAGSVSHADATTPCASATTNRALSTWLPGAVSTPTEADYYRFTTTSSEWALIKLGGLTADLQLKLYDSSCRLITTSQHAGTRFEQIYRSLSAGRYYLGVSGVGGATSSYKVRFAPLSDGTHVLSSHLFTTYYRSDLLEVDGEALNNRSQAWFLRYITVKFYDSGGHLVASTDGSFARSYTGARSRMPFSAQILKPSKSFDRYTVSVTTEDPGNFPVPQTAKIVPSPAWVDSQGIRHDPGSVTNTSTKTVWLGSVAATLYDSYGNVRYMGEGVIVPDSLAPQETGGFDVVIGPAPGVNAVAWLIVD